MRSMAWASLLAGAVLLMAAAPATVPRPGVYKHRFTDALMSGETYPGEDVLEVVPYRAGVDYVRIHMDFANGHECNIWGMAAETEAGLLYRGPPDDQGRPCRLHLVEATGGVHVFEDGGACRSQTCGARGGYVGGLASPPDFAADSRRPIRYMARLVASSEYKAAAAELDASPR